jgi:hypothetical protein
MNRIFNEEMFQFVLRVFAAYGSIQVLAQDLGDNPPRKQSRLIQKFPIEFLILFGGAWTISQSYVAALISTLIYYFLFLIY